MVVLYVPSYDFDDGDYPSDTYDFCDALQECVLESEVSDG